MPNRLASRGAALALLAAVAAGCGAGASSVPSFGASPTAPGASPSAPGASPTAPSGFSLLAWMSQAQPPVDRFAIAARLAIADGLVIDTAVAVPMIYPGPLLIEPVARSISDQGVATIVAELRSQDLLANRDFTGQMPLDGAVGHLELVVDGTRYSLIGDPSAVPRCAATQRCVPDPGTPGAFAAFWQRITGNLAAWLGADVGSQSTYEPERLAILATDPSEAAGPIQPGRAAWTLATFATFGRPLPGGSGQRCGVVTGSDLATLLPVLRGSNQLTRFVDSTGFERSLVVRPLLPGEPDPCASGT